MKKLILLAILALISLSPLFAETADSITSTDSVTSSCGDGAISEKNKDQMELNPLEIQDSIASLFEKLTAVQQRSDTHFWILCSVSILLFVGLLICILLLMKNRCSSQQGKISLHDISRIEKGMRRSFDDVLYETQKIQEEIERQSKQICNNISVRTTMDGLAHNNPGMLMSAGVAKSERFARAHSNSLKECDEKDASYKLDVSGGTARYKFCGKSERAIANKNSVLDPYCEIVAKVDSADKIITVEDGKLSMKSAGEWIVVTKAKIELKR